MSNETNNSVKDINNRAGTAARDEVIDIAPGARPPRVAGAKPALREAPPAEQPEAERALRGARPAAKSAGADRDKPEKKAEPAAKRPAERAGKANRLAAGIGALFTPAKSARGKGGKASESPVKGAARPKPAADKKELPAQDASERTAPVKVKAATPAGQATRPRPANRPSARAAGEGGPGARKDVKYPRRAAKRRRKQKRWWTVPLFAVTGCLLVVTLVLGVGALANYARYARMRSAVDRDTFYPGITVDGEDMSRYTLADAVDQWRAQDAANRAANNIALTIGDKQWTISDKDLAYTDDYADIIESAWSIGRYGTLAQRYEAVAKTAGVWARDYTVNSSYDKDTLMAILSDIATETSVPGSEAKITGFDVDSKGFSFEEGTPGKVVDAHALFDAVTAQIKAGGGEMTYEPIVTLPGNTVADLQGKFGMIASALTEGRHSTDNRLNNLRVACKKINGMVVQPGETYSMNGALGKRTRAAGYKAAGALENGVHTTQLGGGICQVTTTLFNAVARADMQIVEREPHSIPSTYIALGRDATVNWPNQDFKWKNTSDYPVYIVAGMNKKQQVIVQLYGRMREDGITVKLEGIKEQTYAPKETTYVYTNKLETGEKRVVEEKRKGYLASTYRVYYKDGKEIDRVFMFKSYYAPAGAVIEIGK